MAKAVSYLAAGRFAFSASSRSSVSRLSSSAAATAVCGTTRRRASD